MSGHRIPTDMGFAYWDVPDPGTTKSIDLEGKDFAQCALTSATTETRTLPRPTKQGMYCTICVRTYVGAITMTVTGGYDLNGSTTLVFTAAKSWATFQSFFDGTNYYWLIIGTSLTSNGFVVPVTTSTLTITEALHNNKIMVLDLAAGIAITLPVAKAGLWFRFLIKTTFTGASSIKSVQGSDVMVGHALMGNNSDNTVVDWPAIASNTFDTIDMLGTSNSTGGIEGQEIEIIGMGANSWFVSIRGDAAGTEATPFQDTVT